MKFLKQSNVGISYYDTSNNFDEPTIKQPQWKRDLYGDASFVRIERLSVGSDSIRAEQFWGKLGEFNKQFDELEIFSIGGITLTKEIANTLSRFDIVELYLNECNFEPDFVEGISKLKTIRCITINQPLVQGKTQDVNFSSLGNMENLEILVLENCIMDLKRAEYLREKLPMTQVAAFQGGY